MFLFTYQHTVGVEGFCAPDHAQWLRTHTFGMAPLDEGSVFHCDLYLTTRSIRIGPTPMHPVGFEPTIATSQRPQTHAIDHTAKRFLQGFWRSLMPHLLKPIFPFILSVTFYCYFIFLSFPFFFFDNFFAFSLFGWLFCLPSVRFSLISLFSSQFPGRHTHTYIKSRQAGISIISSEISIISSER